MRYPERVDYARNLPDFLGVPQQPLDAWNGFGGSIQYGAFILAEYLEERFPTNGQPDPSAIESLWGRIDDLGGKPIEALSVELGSRGTSMEEFLTGFAASNYVLAPIPPDVQTPGAYDDPEAAVSWRPRLEVDVLGRTTGENDALAFQYGLNNARPARDQHLVVAGQTRTGSRIVFPGGTAYIDLLPEFPDTDGVITADVTTDQDLATVQVLAFDTYPELCQEPELVPLANGTGSVGVAVGNGCRFVTLAVTHNDPEDGSSIPIDWSASLATAGPATNLDFETGDLTGWTIVESGDPGTQYGTVSPGLDGTDHAFHLTSTGQPVDGIQQTIQWQFANCAVEARATGAAGNAVQLSVLDASDGSTWGGQLYMFTGDETGPVDLFVDGPTFYLPTVYTVQLLYVASSTAVDLVIDEVNIQDCI